MQESPTTAESPGGTQEGVNAQHAAWMQRGTRLHESGEPELALLAFEKAQDLAPLDVNTASARAAMLSLLDRPVAALKALLAVEDQLLHTADGAANLAIAAEACGDLVKANAAYAKALQLDANHVRSLNNVGFLAASLAQWDVAIGLAQKCLDLEPAHAPHHANLAEYLSGAHRYADALAVVTGALAAFPADAELRTRHIALLAFNGDLAQADAALAALDAHGLQRLEDFLVKLEPAGNLRPRAGPSGKPVFAVGDALQMYSRQAFRNMALGDWRGHDKLTAAVRAALAKPVAISGRDWGATPFHGLMLGLSENELGQMRQESVAAMDHSLQLQVPPPRPYRRNVAATNSRITVGIAVRSLLDEPAWHRLQRQLAHHDASRFAIHVYAFTPHPQASQRNSLRPFAASVSELVHMTDADAAARMRLDRLDIYLETAGDAGWSLPEIAARRVAAVQLQYAAVHQQHVAGHRDYSLSDAFVHPAAPHADTMGAVVRLPTSGWLACADDTASLFSSREEAGLPVDALLLCSLSAPVALDARTFAAWMKMLRALPDAVLWLPHCSRVAGALVREARAAGVGHSRLLFSAAMPHRDVLGKLRHADLLLDNLCLGSAAGIENALRAGLPALSCAGSTAAARTGGSVLHAANLPDCVFENVDAYIAGVVGLGRDPARLDALQHRVRTSLKTAPLFDIPSRIRELETAWTFMANRGRAGLPPEAFDVPPAGALTQ